MKRFALLCIIALYATASFAIPAQPGLRAVQQPDGSTLMVQLIGDEHFHYHATSDGLPIVKNESGAYVYANMQNDMFVATDVVAHDPSMRNADELNMIRQLQPIKMPESVKQQMQQNNERCVLRAGRTTSQSEKFIGKKRGLIILVDFPDKGMSHTREEFDAMMNQKDYNLNGCIGSLSDYFYDQSYGQLKIDFDVVGPFTTSNPMRYYGENKGTLKDLHVGVLITEAINMAHETGIDFSQYDWTGDGIVDQVFVIYAGYAENINGAPDYTIWPKEGTLKYFSSYDKECGGPISLDGVTVNTFACTSELIGNKGNKICGIGLAAHEFSHCFGLPDFYDTSTARKGVGMGVWSIMDEGCYNRNGYVPCAYTSYERMFCGWLKPVELTADTIIENMRPITEAPEAYIIYNKANRNEYYLLENHQQSHNSDKYHAWDSGAYGHGMLVVHVDYWRNSLINGDADRQGMTIIPANNLFKYGMDEGKEILAGDTYPGATGNTSLTNISEPREELNTPNSDGTYLMNAPITDITENDGSISFCFQRKEEIPDLILIEPAEVDTASFVARWEKVDGAFNYTLELTDLLPSPEYEPVPTTLFDIDLAKIEPFASATEEETEDIGIELGEYLNMEGWVGFSNFVAPQGIKIGVPNDDPGELYIPLYATYDGKVTVKVGVAEDNTITGKLVVNCYDNDLHTEIDPDGKIHVLTIDSIDHGTFFSLTPTDEPVKIFYLSAQALMPPTVSNVEIYKPIESNSISLMDLRANGHYSYRVKAETIYGTTEWSEPMEVWLSSPTSITDIQSSPDQPGAIVFDKQNRRFIIRRNGKWYDLLGRNIK